MSVGGIGLRGGLRTASETVLLNLVSELPEAQPQEFGGSHLKTARAVQSKPDVPRLDSREEFFQVHATGGDLHGKLAALGGLCQMGR